MIRRCGAGAAILAMLALSLVGAPKTQQGPEWWRLTPGAVEACNLLGYTDATPGEVIDWLEARGHQHATAATVSAVWHGCAW
ncbi:hypothetical protein ACJ5H2_13505 [Nocardioides sp. R1-1]|uniref:hypothetical protein n=1 Tax=Nocardioides sp. R1-1 TaxID=3383502 RepID=UPI0038CFD36D